MRIQGRYKIVYKFGVEQFKNLISHTEYDNVIKPKQKRAYDLEVKGHKKLANKIKAEIKDTFGENWFTNKSPLYEVINRGFLNLPTQQGGSKECSVMLF